MTRVAWPSAPCRRRDMVPSAPSRRTLDSAPEASWVPVTWRGSSARPVSVAWAARAEGAARTRPSSSTIHPRIITGDAGPVLIALVAGPSLFHAKRPGLRAPDGGDGRLVVLGPEDEGAGHGDGGAGLLDHAGGLAVDA